MCKIKAFKYTIPITIRNNSTLMRWLSKKNLTREMNCQAIEKRLRMNQNKLFLFIPALPDLEHYEHVHFLTEMNKRKIVLKAATETVLVHFAVYKYASSP